MATSFGLSRLSSGQNMYKNLNPGVYILHTFHTLPILHTPAFNFL